MHVPLIMRRGTRLGGGVHISRLVSLVDIMPTALAMLGIAPPDGLDGQDLTLPQSGPRVVLFETFQGLADHGWAALLGVRQELMKYIYGPRANSTTWRWILLKRPISSRHSRSWQRN